MGSPGPDPVWQEVKEVKIGGHQQIFMEKARTRLTRCAGVKDKLKRHMVRPRCELSGVACCQSCIRNKWMQQTTVLYITSVSALPDSRILEDDVHLAAYTAVPWYISAFCWDYTVGMLPRYHSHHPATTDIQIICICPLGFLCRFVCVSEGFSASEEIPVLSGKLTTVDSQIAEHLHSFPASLQEGDLPSAQWWSHLHFS